MASRRLLPLIVKRPFAALLLLRLAFGANTPEAEGAPVDRPPQASAALGRGGTLTIAVSTNLVESHVPPLTLFDFESVEIARYTSHFLEDFSLHRASGIGRFVNQSLAKPSFRFFFLEGGRLHRHFFVDQTSSFEGRQIVSLHFEATNDLDAGSFHLYHGKFSAIQTNSPAAFPIESIRERILGRVRDLLPRILATDLSPLWRAMPRHFQPLRLTEKALFLDHHRFGLPAMEFLGRRGPRSLWRARLEVADTEAAKREWDIAHAYFAYLEWTQRPETGNGPSSADGDLALIFTLADFSIYTK